MKGKEIKFEDIKNSPYTTAVILVLIILLVIAGIAFLIYDIVQTKQEIVEVRASYQENLKEIAILQFLLKYQECHQHQRHRLSNFFYLVLHHRTECREGFGRTVPWECRRGQC